MERKSVFLITAMILVFITGNLLAQNTPITEANYKLAERFSPDKLKKMVFSTSVDPHWLKLSDRFWYVYETPEGKTFNIVDPGKKTKRPIFDNIKMAALLTLETKDPYDAKHLPIDKIKFVKDETAICFEVESSQMEEEEEKDEEVKKEEEKEEKKKDEKLEKDEKEKKEEEKDKEEEKKDEEQKDKKEKSKDKKKEKKKKKVFHFEYTLATGKLTLLEDFKKPPKKPDWATIAPDSSVVLFSKHYNLYWMDKENYLKALEDEEDSTIVEHRLTTEGVEYYGYGGRSWNETNVDKEKNKDKRKSVRVIWSPDSKKRFFSTPAPTQIFSWEMSRRLTST